MAQRDFLEVFETCLDRVREGEPVESCLADFPGRELELAPVLSLSAELLALPLLEPETAVVDRNLARVMAALPAEEDKTYLNGVGGWLGGVLRPLRRRRKPRALGLLVRGFALAGLVLVLASGLAVTASADSLPGDVLYPVKRTWENARLSLTVGAEERAALAGELNQRRLDEVEALLTLRRPAAVSFDGDLESVAGGIWTLEGLPVVVDEATLVDAAAAPGEPVHVEAEVQADGTLRATGIFGADKRLVPPRPVPSPSSTPTVTRTRPPAAIPPTRDLPPTRVSPTPKPVDHPPRTRTPEPTRTPERTRPSNRTPHPSRTPRPQDTPPPHWTPPPNWTPPPHRTPLPNWTPPPTWTPQPHWTPWPTRTPKVDDGPTPTRVIVGTPPVDSLTPVPSATLTKVATYIAPSPTPHLEPTRNDHPTAEPTPTHPPVVTPPREPTPTPPRDGGDNNGGGARP